MARLWHQTFENREGQRYTVELNFDEEGLDLFASTVAFAIEAEMYDPRADSTQKVEASVTIERRTFEATSYVDGVYLIIEIDGRSYEFMLAGTWEQDLVTDPESTEESCALEDPFFPDSFSHGIEELIQAAPVVIEPTLGCVLKSGIAATVGQLIRCNNSFLDPEVAADMPNKSRVRFIFGCLREQSGRVSKKVLFRTFKCWATLGLG